MRKAMGLLVGGALALFVVTVPASAQHAAVGADKCAKMCHKVQFQSWSQSKHATAKDKKADCETCHGNGAEYMKMSIMKDPAKAKEAGLIAKPDKASCAKCHKPGEMDGKLSEVHAHKAK
jgi:hypothetical protein